MSNEELVDMIQNGVDVSENMLQLWRQNQGYIRKIAMKFRGYEELEDLIQEGYFGLHNAVTAYNPDEGVSFLTYAGYWIRQTIQRYVECCGGIIRIPSQERSAMQKYKKLVNSFTSQIGREPTERETLYYLEMYEERFARLKKNIAMASVSSLDVPVRGMDDEGVSVGDTIAGSEDIEESVLDKIQTAQLKETIWILVDGLPKQQAEVLRTRFIEGLTMKETGVRMEGLTKDSVRQIQSKALRELRHSKAAKQLMPFLDDYIDSRAYRGNGVRRFMDTWTSSTEQTAMALLEKKCSERSQNETNF